MVASSAAAVLISSTACFCAAAIRSSAICSRRFAEISASARVASATLANPIESTPLKRWQLCLNVNLTGVFLVTKAVIPHVKARGGGSLIAITTTGVGMIEHGSNAYWVSKAGVERLFLGLASDLKPDNIAVNCLSPSRVVLTEGWQAGGGGMKIPPEMVEPPEAMAELRELATSAGGRVIAEFLQRRQKPNPATLIGSGKLEVNALNLLTLADF